MTGKRYEENMRTSLKQYEDVMRTTSVNNLDKRQDKTNQLILGVGRIAN